jgi:hypothetical protein
MGLVCKCGSNLFVRTRQARGPWVELIDGDGEIDSTDLDKMVYTTPKTVSCAECNRRHPNPELTSAVQAERNPNVDP